MADINSATWSETPANNNAVSPNGWKSGTMLPSEVEPTGREMMAALKKWYDHSNGVKTSGGAANVQTLTYDVAPTAYVTGDFYLFKAGFSNTAATTLNVNALGAKTVQRAGAALALNDIISGYYYGVVYDGTNFQLVVITQPIAGTSQASVASPAATPSAVQVMLGGAVGMTPNRSGRVLFIISGLGTNSTAGDGYQAQIRYGTGAAPANGAAAAGTAAGSVLVNIPPTGFALPFTLQVVVTGLTVGTAYWYDLGFAVYLGGAASITNVTYTAVELP